MDEWTFPRLILRALQAHALISRVSGLVEAALETIFAQKPGLLDRFNPPPVPPSSEGAEVATLNPPAPPYFADIISGSGDQEKSYQLGAQCLMTSAKVYKLSRWLTSLADNANGGVTGQDR